MRHYVVGLITAYAILIQTLATPFQQVQAAERTRFDGSLAVLCLGGASTEPDEKGVPNASGGHLLDCCLPGLRPWLLDGPALIVSAFSFSALSPGTGQPFRYAFAQGRAPPVALAVVLQPRAPPVSIV